ncbi:hypothetical protein EVAR_99130_1 [Eumeta japonica]|uniref:Uncharacterized protein n=1 Tax=Eumeta variegata TaxID=151549 RepID=A0A4C1YMA4_EUMVA|nr:hypothetical protein EVAR_99130_1 [Eumeta japonica]
MQTELYRSVCSGRCWLRSLSFAEFSSPINFRGGRTTAITRRRPQSTVDACRWSLATSDPRGTSVEGLKFKHLRLEIKDRVRIRLGGGQNLKTLASPYDCRRAAGGPFCSSTNRDVDSKRKLSHHYNITGEASRARRRDDARRRSAISEIATRYCGTRETGPFKYVQRRGGAGARGGTRRGRAPLYVNAADDISLSRRKTRRDRFISTSLPKGEDGRIRNIIIV